METVIKITKKEAESNHIYSNAIDTALSRALAGEGKVTQELLSISGMSGGKYRRFINNLVELVDNPRYLEVGSWAGSTLCSAIYANKVRALAIDNWSQFGGPQNQFFSNLGAFTSNDASVSFLNSDFREVNYSSIGKFNIYLFDGPHDQKDQYDGLTMAQPALEDQIIFIVDDWNWPFVRSGTIDAISDAGWEVLHSVEIRSTSNDLHPGEQGLPCNGESDWHNGYYIGLLSRS